MRGRLITFEGIDGSGKTTHVRLLEEYLRSAGFDPLCLREPGGTALGEALRSLLKGGLAKSAVAELMLFAAARAELVEICLKPQLETGRVVLLDRFTDSTIAYQGALESLDADSLATVCRLAAGGLVPDLTFWLDISPQAAFARIGPANADGSPCSARDTIEDRGIDYFARIRQRYSEIAARGQWPLCPCRR